MVQRGFTLIELVIVLALFGVITIVAGYRTGSIDFWRQESALREFVDTAQFLHQQAITDQAFYQLDISFTDNSYRVGILRPESDLSNISPEDEFSDIGNLTRELNDFINPELGDSQTLIPPPSFPSLFEPQRLPAGMLFEHILTNRAEWSRDVGENARILFSPRGFSEFAVLHLRSSNEKFITLLINPYTGAVEIFREFKEFTWKGRDI